MLLTILGIWMVAIPATVVATAWGTAGRRARHPRRVNVEPVPELIMLDTGRRFSPQIEPVPASIRATHSSSRLAARRLCPEVPRGANTDPRSASA